MKIVFRYIFALVLAASLFAPTQILADVDTSSPEYQKKQQEIVALKEKISQVQGEAKTLSSAISYLSNKKELTQKQIDATQYEITLLNHDVTSLSGKISSLEESLDAHTQALITDIQVDYKSPEIDPFHLVFSSSSFTDYQTRARYLELAQEQHSQILKKATEVKLEYDVQKSQKEEKQKKVAQLQAKLTVQQRDLIAQEETKRRILLETKNSEANYQRLLSQAEAELAAFRSFVQSQGGASILSNQTSCTEWGCYYNQRDSSWGTKALGNSNSSVAEYGCLVSSVAMVATHYKKNLKPIDIAMTSAAFFYPTAFLNKDFTVNGIHVSRVSVTGSLTSTIDSELSAGRPVIIGLYSSSAPKHFIVFKSGSNGNYIMHDPFMENGHDVPFTVKYKVSDIRRVDKISIN